MIDPKVGKDTQFKEGESGNPDGRPKGSKNYSTRVKELLAGISDDKEWASPLAAEKIKIIFSKKIIGKDKNNKPIHSNEYVYPINERQKAIDSIINQLEGMPIQKSEIKAELENIQINFGKID